MNIKTKIERIRQQINAAKTSDFCACENNPKYPRTEIVYWENGKPASSPDLVNKTLPDECLTCRKPIHKTQIIIDFVDARKPKAEGAK